MEEKIEKLSGLLQKLKGKKVYLIDKSSLHEDLVGKYVIIGETQGERCDYWLAGGGKFVNAFGKEEYDEPHLTSINAYIGNIAAITLFDDDLYIRDIPENILFEDKEMFNESKGKTH